MCKLLFLGGGNIDSKEENTSYRIKDHGIKNKKINVNLFW